MCFLPFQKWAIKIVIIKRNGVCVCVCVCVCVNIVKKVETVVLWVGRAEKEGTISLVPAFILL